MMIEPSCPPQDINLQNPNLPDLVKNYFIL